MFPPEPHETQPPKERRFLQEAGFLAKLAVLLWSIVFIVIAVRVIVAPQSMSVYPIFANAARNWWQGADLYRAIAYRYSPFVTIVLTPFALLPDGLGGLLWRVLNGVVFFGAFAWWIRTLVPQAASSSEKAVLYLLIVPLSVGSLNNGQSNPLVIGFLLASIAAAHNERWNLAAAAVMAASVLKIYPIAVGLLLAAIYPRRMAWRLGVALAIGLLAPFAFQTPAYVARQYDDWLQHLYTQDRQGLAVNQWYRDFRLLCHLAHAPIASQTYRLLQAATAAGIAGICVAGQRLGWNGRFLLTTLLAMACCWMTVFGSATESTTYMLLGPSLSVSLWLAWRDRSPWVLRLGLVFSHGSFMLSQTSVWFPFRQRVHDLGIHPLAGFVYLICVLGSAAMEKCADRSISLPSPREQTAHAA
jgi:hypothetical protein